ncbi:uncharacterized protein TCAP_04677 [Tolypocladium capitatum]|uniref:Uncharacterized protein n=1 Tax=Tolypocladium capitatum TaxID=45235 RepID=A0A2K3QCX5_9HYPO|nr:uncharacterized protein TCAP_04677 [Tolypocladium capitatum]
MQINEPAFHCSRHLLSSWVLKDCETSQLIHIDVNSCTCPPKPMGRSTPCLACGSNPIKRINGCTGGCVDKHSGCEGCGIWFRTPCDHLKHQKTCKNSGTIIQKNGPAVWVLLEASGSSDDLIATTEPPPWRPRNGTESRGARPGLDLPTNQALAMNSVRTRTHEQVHIHVRSRNGATAILLSNEPIKSSTRLIRLKVLGSQAKLCKYIVGAGIVKDHKSHTRACVLELRRSLS